MNIKTLRHLTALILMAAVILILAGCTAATTQQGQSTTTATPGQTGTTAPGQTGTTSPGQTTASTAPGQATTSTLPPSSDGGTSPAVAVARNVGPSVVNVRVSGIATSQFGDQPFEGIGSGIIYSGDGHIITNNHVVTQNGQPASSIEVTLSTGEVLPATIVGRDEFTDIAVVKVNRGTLPVARFASSANIVVGEYAIAIGSPLDYQNSVTLGIVSGLNRTIAEAGSPSLVDLIQIDAAISPGNSGGAILNQNGEVIGVAVAYLPPGQTGAVSIGFAIPSDTAVSVAQQLISTGTARHPYLGIQTTSITPQLQQQFGLSRDTGALVTQVVQNTPAEQAGIQQGDIIISIDGSQVTGPIDVITVLRQKNPGDTVTIVLVRNNQEMTVKATLTDRPAQL